MIKCAFTGHRPQNLPFGFNEDDERCVKLKEMLRNEIVDLIENKGVTCFISGMALGVDMWAAEIVLDLKKKYENIELKLVIPCMTQSNSWPPKEQGKYRKILWSSDSFRVLGSNYTPDCMNKRNRQMVNEADIILAVWNGTPSGTGNTVEYAKSLGKDILVIDPKDL